MAWSRTLSAIGSALVLLLGVGGCDSLAGIQSGTLVDAAAGADAADDAQAAVDATADASDAAGGLTDAGRDSSVDGGGDAEAGPVCPTGQLACSGGCIPSDLHNCGACGNDCTTLPNVNPIGLTCAGTFCSYNCSPGWGDCTHMGAGCGTSLGKNGDCGACGVTCSGSTPVCTGGGCGASCAAPTPDACGTTCVDLQTDPTNCGSCGRTCSTSVVNATSTCSGGSCSYACKTTYTACGGACVDETSDSNNCGACGNACSGGTHCAGSNCVCSAGQHSCGSPPSCVTDDVNSCGTGCVKCSLPSNGSVTCTGGTTCTPSCPTAPNTTLCTATNACVDLTSDALNCGSCGAACGAHQQCVGKACQCVPGATTCSGACVDLTNDPNNCGACGHSCLGSTCNGSTCTPTVLYKAGGYVFGLAIDSSTIYFTTGVSGQIASCPLTGACTPTMLYTITTPSQFAGYLTYDQPDGILYVTNPNTSAVYGVPIGGGQAPGYPVTGTLGGGNGITSSGTNLYWGASGGIATAVRATGASPATFFAIPGSSQVWDVTYDAASSNLFAAVAIGAGPGELLQCTLTGSCTATPASGVPFSNLRSVMVYGGTVYFGADGTSAASHADGGLFSVPVGMLANAAKITPLATGQTYSSTQSIVTDGTNLYFGAFGSGNVYKCAMPSCAGGPVLVVSGAGEVSAMALDASYLYLGADTQLEKVAK